MIPIQNENHWADRRGIDGRLFILLPGEGNRHPGSRLQGSPKVLNRWFSESSSKDKGLSSTSWEVSLESPEVSALSSHCTICPITALWQPVYMLMVWQSYILCLYVGFWIFNNLELTTLKVLKAWDLCQLLFLPDIYRALDRNKYRVSLLALSANFCSLLPIPCGTLAWWSPDPQHGIQSLKLRKREQEAPEQSLSRFSNHLVK